MKKWFQNFWYYYKVHTIIVLVILAVGIYFMTLGRTEISDYDAAVISSGGLSGEQLEKLKSVLEQTGEDQTGNGKTTVNIHVFRFSLGEDGQDTYEIAKLDADLVGKVSGIFLTEDPEIFEEATNGIGKAAGALSLSDIPSFSGCGLDDLFILVRTDADPKYTELLSELTD